MTRRMIVRIGDEQNAAKPKGTHTAIITQATLGLEEPFRPIWEAILPSAALQSVLQTFNESEMACCSECTG
jgi:hypothetical protein